MALDFPTTGLVTNVTTYGRWVWNGTSWVAAAVSVPPDQAITGDLRVDGDTTLADALITGTLQVNGDTSVNDIAVGGTLDVTGQAT